MTSLLNAADLRGRVVVITGGSTGIGLETVKALLQQEAKVYFTTRSETKARQTKEYLINDLQCDLVNINWLIMDLSDPTSVYRAADELRVKESRVDILINNAGDATASTDLVFGEYERHMATNYMGPFLFTNLLLPLLKNASQGDNADVRIVNITSIAHVTMLPRNFDFQFASPNCFKSPVSSNYWLRQSFFTFIFGFDIVRYAVSKTAVVLFTKELQNRMDERNLPIICTSVHPGEVLTNGMLGISSSFMKLVAWMSFVTPEEGAATPLFAAAASKPREHPDKYKGAFLVPVGRIGLPNPAALSRQNMEDLWKNTFSVVNELLACHGLPELSPW